MTSMAAHAAPPTHAQRAVVVVSVHRADALSGVSAAGARLARLAHPHTPWRPLVIGEDLTPDRLAESPLAEAPGLDSVSWPTGTDPVRQVLIVRDKLRQLGAGVVVPNDLPHAFLAAALDAHRGVRCAALLHGNDAMAHDLYRRCLHLADAWRAVSDAVLAGALACGATGASGAPLPVGLHVPDTPTPFAGPLPPARALRLFYAARLENLNKRSSDLVDLADELHGLGTRFLLTIAGDGPARPALERHLAGHIADGRVVMLGPVPMHAMGALFTAHDVAVLVSRSEGWPLVVMEAMAAGRPCAITSGCGGATRLVRDGVEGIVVHTGDMPGLARRLAGLAVAPTTLERMGHAAHAAARAHLDVSELGHAYDAFVCEALSRRRDSAASDGARRAADLASRWGAMLAALELIGPCDPAPLAAAWLGDMHTPPLALHITHGALDLAHTMARVTGKVAGVLGPDAATERWMGWTVLVPEVLEAGTLVLSPQPESVGPIPDGVSVLPLRLPGLLCPSDEVFLRAAERLRAKGRSRFGVYGAGRHTTRIARALERVPEVVAIIDDRAGTECGPPERLWGLPVVAPKDAGPLELDGLIISSDEHEDAMLVAAARWAGSIPVVPLYRE